MTRPQGEPFKSPDRLLFTLAEVATLRSLELAGSRLKARENRSLRGRLTHIPKWDAHIEIRATSGELEKLLKGAWDIPTKAGCPADLLNVLDSHCRQILIEGTAYSRDALRGDLRVHGFLS
jgi:hypothetical protein